MESAPAAATPQQGRADAAMRRLLRIPDESRRTAGSDAQRAFTTSVLVSATRCLLTYVVLPFVAPAVGFAAGVGPWVGIPLSVVAVAANVVSIRRFWYVEHPRRWLYTAIGVAVIALLVVLLGQDVAELAT